MLRTLAPPLTVQTSTDGNSRTTVYRADGGQDLAVSGSGERVPVNARSNCSPSVDTSSYWIP
ncbi:hypothetical protein [Micromonospora sp. RTGN7]|uniref:hypothetical protein n=1 Tax=Micromonospora sp. RTGN7 TaxID=3016526 RepID=UPI0029FEF8BC|nr:hypothetical protein [Micromonospora sp. RTGN7]